jgi:hypothetical protein
LENVIKLKIIGTQQKNASLETLGTIEERNSEKHSKSEQYPQAAGELDGSSRS